MKKVAVLLLFAVLAVGVARAQEEPIPPKRSKIIKVGLFGGFTAGWLAVNVKPINEFLVAANGEALSDKGVFMYGGAGAAYIMLVPNLRIGGMGMSGSTSSSKLINGLRRDAELHVGCGGVTVEYVIPVTEHLDFSVGTLLGAGGIDITLREDVGSNKTWEQEWTSFGSGNYQTGGQINNISRTMSGSYFIAVPAVNVEYAILAWFAVRVGASYVAMFAPSWQLDAKYDLLNVPSGVSGKGFMVNAGLLIGTF